MKPRFEIGDSVVFLRHGYWLIANILKVFPLEKPVQYNIGLRFGVNFSKYSTELTAIPAHPEVCYITEDSLFSTSEWFEKHIKILETTRTNLLLLEDRLQDILKDPQKVYELQSYPKIREER